MKRFRWIKSKNLSSRCKWVMLHMQHASLEHLTFGNHLIHVDISGHYLSRCKGPGNSLCLYFPCFQSDSKVKILHKMPLLKKRIDGVYEAIFSILTNYSDFLVMKWLWTPISFRKHFLKYSMVARFARGFSKLRGFSAEELHLDSPWLAKLYLTF